MFGVFGVFGVFVVFVVFGVFVVFVFFLAIDVLVVVVDNDEQDEDEDALALGDVPSSDTPMWTYVSTQPSFHMWEIHLLTASLGPVHTIYGVLFDPSNTFQIRFKYLETAYDST